VLILKAKVKLIMLRFGVVSLETLRKPKRANKLLNKLLNKKQTQKSDNSKMKHIVVLHIIDEPKPKQWVVIEEPPLILTWRGMFFQFNRKITYLPKTYCTKYIYNEVNGCPLAAISTPEIVDEPN
jgi:hypothetical protein